MQKPRSRISQAWAPLSPPKNWACKTEIRKSQKKFWATNCNSENCHIYGRSANLTNLVRLGTSLQICDLRKLFEDSPPLKHWGIICLHVLYKKIKATCMLSVQMEGHSAIFKTYMYLSSRMKNDFF